MECVRCVTIHNTLDCLGTSALISKINWTKVGFMYSSWRKKLGQCLQFIWRPLAKLQLIWSSPKNLQIYSSHSQLLPLLPSKVYYHSLKQTEKLPNCTNGKIESHHMCSAILPSLSQDCGYESVQLVEISVPWSYTRDLLRVSFALDLQLKQFF